jgi:DNA-binding Lrp family transcriptional regulator
LDKIDKKILQILQGDARITNSRLSKEIGLSPAPTMERVKKLESSMVIKGYHANLNKEVLGLDVASFIQISLKDNKKATVKKFIDHISEIDEIVECYQLTGQSDVLLKVITESISTYQKLIVGKLTEIDEIDRMESLVVLNTLKKTNSHPIP